METALYREREQIIHIMARIYEGGMTTMSGGNISFRDANNDLYITPSGLDKGALTVEDLVCVRADGSVEGRHKPSSEHPFHRAIYQQRPDLRAIVHGHPPALVSFSIVRKVPDTNVIPQARQVCGRVGYAPYKMPGTAALAEGLAQAFSENCNAVIMENHGTVVAGETLAEAYQRFETLEFCGRTLIKASEIGMPHMLTEEQIVDFEESIPLLPEQAAAQDEEEQRLREEICTYVRRAIRQKLMISTYGVLSCRWKGDDFVITPNGMDRGMLRPTDLVQIRNGAREEGKVPSRSVQLHQAIYRRHPHIQSIMITQSPNVMAFAITGTSFNTHTIPESYVLLQEIPLMPYGSFFGDLQTIPNALSADTPLALVQNDALLVTGGSIHEAYDRLEVAEFSARALINTVPLGEMVPLQKEELDNLRQRYLS